MRVWWCVALCVCARATLPGAAALAPQVAPQAIETETEDASEPDPLLVALQVSGYERAALCGRGPARGCPGALWGRRWLLARASCAAALPARQAAVLPHRGAADCGPGAPECGGIPVLARFVHPQYWGEAEAGPRGAHDAALLLLAAPAPVAPRGNHSRALLLVPELERWLQSVPAALPGSWDRPPARARGADVARLRLTGSPLRLLGAAVLLPAAALLLLFALALRLPPAAPADPRALLDHDALEHAPPYDLDDKFVKKFDEKLDEKFDEKFDENFDEKFDEPTADRLAFL